MLIRSSLFILVAGSKTLVSIGQACLTVDATVLTLNCLAQYHKDSIEYDAGVHAVNIASQLVAATFSTLMIMLTRYPATWDKLSVNSFRNKLDEFDQELSDSSKTIKWSLALIGLMGFLSCMARGMSAYLGAEVILGDRAGADSTLVAWIGWIAALAITLSSMCFNLSNMLTSAVKYLKSPTFSLKPSIVISFIATVSAAVAKRFFIAEFLDRRGTGLIGQVVGQSVFTAAEFVLGLFTMVSSFEDNWQDNAKAALKSSVPFAIMVVGDAITALLGYNTITWYSILSDTVIGTPSPDTSPINVCLVKPSDSHFSLSWAFMATAFVISVPAVFAYFHYLLSYAKSGYDREVGLVQSAYRRCRYGVFEQDEGQVFSRLHVVPPALQLVENKLRMSFFS